MPVRFHLGIWIFCFFVTISASPPAICGKPFVSNYYFMKNDKEKQNKGASGGCCLIIRLPEIADEMLTVCSETEEWKKKRSHKHEIL